jgi:hypothetical protein
LELELVFGFEFVFTFAKQAAGYIPESAQPTFALSGFFLKLVFAFALVLELGLGFKFAFAFL